MPYKLPADLVAFYQMFDGFKLSYNTEVSGAMVPVGMLFLNALSDLQRVAIEGLFPGHANTASMTSAGFSLDTRSEVGTTVLLYRSKEDKISGQSDCYTSDASSESYDSPEVWFVDRSARWHFLSASFSDFLRLMVVHVGIFGWQLAFTPEGLPPMTQQWMQLFARERLVMDISCSSHDKEKQE